MHASPAVLLGSFQRDVVVGPLDSAFPEKFSAETELYDYDSDSDFEDGEDEEDSAPPSDSTHQTSTPSMTEIAASNKVQRLDFASDTNCSYQP